MGAGEHKARGRGTRQAGHRRHSEGPHNARLRSPGPGRTCVSPLRAMKSIRSGLDRAIAHSNFLHEKAISE